MTLALSLPSRSSHVVQFVWPIVDDSMSRNQLITEAEPELDAFVDAHGTSLAGPPMWTVAEAAETPGWEAHAPGLVLIAVAPAQPIDVGDTIDEIAVQRAIRGDRSVELARAEVVAAIRVGAERLTLSDGEIADRLGLSGRNVARIRVKHGIAAALRPGGQVAAA